MKIKKVALLTAGGLAPCLSSSVGGLIERYSELHPEVEIICYKNGFKGLLLGDSYKVTPHVRKHAAILHEFGGSPIGNSRVKLTNVEDCLKHKLINQGQDPLKVAADQLVKDGVNVLHTIGGDDTNLVAAELAEFLEKNKYHLTVVGLPKTVDNDIHPIAQTLGAHTAAEQSARFFENVVAEHSANPRMLIVHEIMGRNCGWLTVHSAIEYQRRLKSKSFLPEMGLSLDRQSIHAVYIPEMEPNILQEAARLRQVMDHLDCVNIFISEGAGVKSIVAEMEARGEAVPRDAFGHVKLDAINPGQWFGKQFAKMINAEKMLVQKSGYFARAAAANTFDLCLIKSCVDVAVDTAVQGISGVVGHDEEHGGRLCAIEFKRIKGGKLYKTNEPIFHELLKEIGQI